MAKKNIIINGGFVPASEKITPSRIAILQQPPSSTIFTQPPLKITVRNYVNNFFLPASSLNPNGGGGNIIPPTPSVSIRYTTLTGSQYSALTGSQYSALIA